MVTEVLFRNFSDDSLFQTECCGGPTVRGSAAWRAHCKLQAIFQRAHIFARAIDIWVPAFLREDNFLIKGWGGGNSGICKKGWAVQIWVTEYQEFVLIHWDKSSNIKNAKFENNIKKTRGGDALSWIFKEP